MSDSSTPAARRANPGPNPDPNAAEPFGPWGFAFLGIALMFGAGMFMAAGLGATDEGDDGAELVFYMLGLSVTFLGAMFFLIGVIAQGIRIGMRAVAKDGRARLAQ
ncbi:MAG: hypothetical protein CMH83_21740 [Nocardioides sp.]|nr:hypothetical protein [Nocardioides sp.]